MRSNKVLDSGISSVSLNVRGFAIFQVRGKLESSFLLSQNNTEVKHLNSWRQSISIALPQ